MAIGVISASIPVNIGVTARHQAKYTTVKEPLAHAKSVEEAVEPSLTASPSTSGTNDEGGIINILV